MDHNAVIVVTMMVAGFVAEAGSRFFQLRKKGFVDEARARSWRQKVFYSFIGWLLIFAVYHLWPASTKSRCAPERSETWAACSR